MRPCNEAEITLVLCVDDEHIRELAHSLPTWLHHKPQMRNLRVMLLVDDAATRCLQFVRDSFRRVDVARLQLTPGRNQRDEMVEKLERIQEAEGLLRSDYSKGGGE